MPKKRKTRNKILAVPTTKILERSYYSKIYQSTLKPMAEQLRDKIIPEIKVLVEEHKRDITKKVDSKRLDVSFGKKITKLFESVDVSLSRVFIPDEDVKEMEKRTNKTNEKNIDKQMETVLGIIPFKKEDWQEAQREAFVEENVSLIKSLPKKFFPDIEELIRRRITEGVSTRKIAKELMQKFQATKRRAKLIARDQINKHNAKLTELRQKEAGIKTYIWTTVKDERVRGKKGGLYPKAKPSHAALHGKEFSWKEPPVSGVKGERQHPGFPINCRCIAVPKMPE